MNDGKTAIMPVNIAREDCDPKYEFKTSKWFLGLEIQVIDQKLSLEKAAENLIQRLNRACPVLVGLRKVVRSLEERLDSASKLVHSALYDLGIIYVYASDRMFTNICICIRKVIRLAGLDSQTPREIVYALSIKLTPEQIAHKQIFQMGLKIACEKDPNEYRIGNRFRLKSYPVIIKTQRTYSVLFSLIQSHSVLFSTYSVLFSHIQSYSISFDLIQSYSVLFSLIWSYFVLFSFIMSSWVLFCVILTQSVSFDVIRHYSAYFSGIRFSDSFGQARSAQNE